MPPKAKIQAEISVNKRKARAEAKGLAGTFSKTMSKLAPLGGMLLGGAGLAGLGMAAKKVVQLDGALTRLAIQAHKSQEEEKVLKKTILDTAVATGVGRDRLQEYLQGVTDMTGDLDLATSAMDAVGQAAQVTGADMNGLGLIVSDMSSKFNLSGKEAGNALAVMIEQGEKGRFTLNEMARTGSEAMSVAGLAGMEGAEGLREMGAVLQLMRQGFSSAEKTATGFRTVVTKIYSPEAKKRLDELKVALRVPETGELRKFGDIFLDVLDKAKGDVTVLAKIFGSEGILGVAEFNRILKESGGNIEAVKDELNRFRNVTGSARDMQEKVNRIMAGTEGKAALLKEQLSKLVEETLLTETSMKGLGVAFDGLAVSAGWMGENIKETAGFIKEWAEKLGLVKKEQKLTDEEMADRSQAARAAASPSAQRARRGFAGIATEQASLASAITNPEMEAALKYYMGETGIENRDKAWGKLHSELQNPGKYENIVQGYTLNLRKNKLQQQRDDLLSRGVDPSKIFEGATGNEVKLSKETVRDLIDAFEKRPLEVNVTTPTPLSQPGGTQPTTKTEALK